MTMRVSKDRIDMDDKVLQKPVLKDYGETVVTANSGTSYTINLTSGNVFNITLTGDCEFTFANPPASGTAGSFTLLLTQDATAGRTATWPGAVKWPDGTAPTLYATAGSANILTFFTINGGATWFGADAQGVEAVNISYLQTAINTSDLTTYTFSSQNFGTASSDRVLVVGFSGAAAFAERTVSSVTVGGIAATEIHFISDYNSHHIGMFYAAVPTGTSGDVVITMSGAMARCAISLWSITGATTSAPYASNVAENTNTTSCNVASNGGAIAYCYNQEGTLRTVTWTGVNEDFDEEIESGRSHHGGHQNLLSIETSRTFTATFSTGGDPAIIAASWN